MDYVFKLYLVIINIISFLLYFIDKRKAIKHRYRIPEKILFLSGLFGGCYGSIIGIYLLRHKTKHLKFTLTVPLFCIIWTYIILKELQIL